MVPRSRGINEESDGYGMVMDKICLFFGSWRRGGSESKKE
jgi:hypothetical protein